VYLARVIGRVVASVRYPGFDRVALQWIQPLDERGADSGDALVACACVSTGPGDLVQFVDGREAALACPDETFVPIDASIVGFVEQAYANGRMIGREEAPAAPVARTPAGDAERSGPSRTEAKPRKERR
jgi:ethanolamine utilization protein EutN